MTDPTPEMVKQMARQICAADAIAQGLPECAVRFISGEWDKVSCMRVTIAAIIETSEHAANLADTYLEPVLSRDLRAFDHIKPENG